MTFTSCTSNSQSDLQGNANNKTVHTLKDSIYYTVFHTQTDTYGFNIIRKGKIYIHQPIIPTWQGLHNFVNEEDAAAIAKLIVGKLRSKDFKFLLQKVEVDSLLGLKKRYAGPQVMISSDNSNSNIIESINVDKTSKFIFEIIRPLADPPIKNKWTVKGTVPFGPRAGGFCFVIGKNVYIGSGENSDQIIKDNWSYNTDLEIWTCLAEIPVRCFSGFSFSIFNKGYVGLGTEIGTSSGKFEKHVYQFDPLLNTWKIEEEFSGTGRIDPAFFVIGNKGYVGTGYDGSNTKDFYEFDPLKEKWKQIADFAGGNLHASVGIGNGQRGFLVAGAAAPNDFKFVYEYLPIINKWQQKQDLPTYSRNFHSGNYIDTNYFIAGAGGAYQLDKRLKDFYIYNIKNNLWSKIGNYPCDINGSTRAISGSIDGKVYMGTGFGSDEMNDWNLYEYYFSIRKDTGTYNETVCYPLKYNGNWELYQECTGEDCYAGISIRSKEQLGNFCYASHYAAQGKELNLLNDKYFVLPRSFAIQTQKQPQQKAGIRLFFTRDELLDAISSYQKKTGLLFSPDNIKILQCNEKTPDCSIDNNHFQKTSSQFLHPVWYQYGANGETIVAEFSTTVIQSEFYAVISSFK